MFATIALALSLQAQPSGIVAGRYELSDRLKELDVAWTNCVVTDRRRAAVEDITRGYEAIRSKKISEAAEFLDTAIADLEGRDRRSSDAVTLRSASPFSPPGASVRVLISWAYKPASVVPIRVSAGSKTVTVKPGVSATLDVNPADVNPDLRRDVEVGYLLPVRVGNDQRHVYLSLVKNVESRIKALRASTSPHVKELASFLQEFVEKPSRIQEELPLIQYLFSAEQLQEERVRLVDLEQVYRAQQGETTFRAAIPKALRGVVDSEVNLVVALAGGTGSENSFFEMNSRGRAVSEALDRGWVFMSGEGATAVQDCISWLTKSRRLRVKNLFLMGHDSGGAAALRNEGVQPSPTAVAAFAPSAIGEGGISSGVPLFLAVGKQDHSGAHQFAKTLADSLGGNGKFHEYDPCEHLMVAGDAIGDAYSFFDHALNLGN